MPLTKNQKREKRARCELRALTLSELGMEKLEQMALRLPWDEQAMLARAKACGMPLYKQILVAKLAKFSMKKGNSLCISWS